MIFFSFGGIITAWAWSCSDRHITKVWIQKLGQPPSFRTFWETWCNYLHPFIYTI